MLTEKKKLTLLLFFSLFAMQLHRCDLADRTILLKAASFISKGHAASAAHPPPALGRAAAERHRPTAGQRPAFGGPVRQNAWRTGSTSLAAGFTFGDPACLLRRVAAKTATHQSRVLLKSNTSFSEFDQSSTSRRVKK